MTDDQRHAQLIATIVLSLVIIAAITGGCTLSRAVTPSNLPVVQTTTTSTVTFTKDIRCIALIRCSGCHQGRMTDYNAIIRCGYVFPGSPELSPYYTIGRGKMYHPGGNAWAENECLVRQWIASGAPS